MHPGPEVQAVIETDDGLGRLGNRVPYHEHERRIVAGDAESAHAVIP